MTEVIEIGNLSGPKGDPGPPGQGVPTGGTSSQVLTKNSSTNYDASWQPPAGGSPSGTAGGGLSGTYPNPNIADDAVTNAKLSNMAANTIKGAVVLGDPVNLTAAQATAVIASGSGGGTANFLRADGTWASPPAATGVAADVLFDAKGDIAVGTGPDAAARLPAGADNQILTADSSTSTGMKWTTPAAAGIASSDTTTVDLAGDGVTVPLSANVLPAGITLNQFSPPTANINMNAMQMVNVGGATSALHAMNRNSCDSRYPQLSTLTAKGNLYVANASGTVIAEPVGTNNQVLTADSATASGVKWATPAASTVSVVPQGEQVGTDVQSAISNLDTRVSVMLEKGPDFLQDWCLLYDEFMGSQSASLTASPGPTTTQNAIGSLGWIVTVAQGGAVAPPAAGIGQADAPGFVNVQTGNTVATGSANMVLEVAGLSGHPIFICEWRILVNGLNAVGTEEFSLRFGLGDTTTPFLGPMNDGYYFEYIPADTTWHVLTAKGAARDNKDTNIAVDTSWHRFRIVSDGGGAVTFTIDGATGGIPPHNSAANIPVSNEFFSPGIGIQKSVGIAQRIARVDYFYLLWGVNR